MIRLVLFDIDGTLIRTGGAGVRAFGKVFHHLFRAVHGFERLKFAGRTDISLVREFFGYHGIPATEQNFKRFFDDYVFWLDHILRDCHGGVCPGVRELLAGFRALPNPPVVGLLTGNIRLGAEIKLRHFGLWGEFATGGFADDGEDRNQIAAIAKERGSRLAGAPLAGDQVLVVGDTPLDIACGRAIGAKVLAVTTGGATIDQLEAHRPDLLVTDLRHISASQAASI